MCQSIDAIRILVGLQIYSLRVVEKSTNRSSYTFLDIESGLKW